MPIIDKIFYILRLIFKFIAFLFALSYIAITAILFFALYGIYLLMNNLLLGINYIIYGLNIIVTPIAKGFQDMIDAFNDFGNTLKDPGSWFK
jgi:hypothetical protein